jgi:hypothetical protein
MSENKVSDPITDQETPSATIHETEELHRLAQSRDRVLARLWEIADLAPEKTRNGMSAQVKALSLIIAIEGLIPDRRAVSAQRKTASQPEIPPFYVSEWMRTQKNGQSVDPQPPLSQEEVAPEPQSQSASRCADDPAHTPNPTSTELSSSSSQPERSVAEGPAVSGPLNPSQSTPLLPRVPMADFVAPDTRHPFWVDKTRFGRRR